MHRVRRHHRSSLSRTGRGLERGDFVRSFRRFHAPHIRRQGSCCMDAPLGASLAGAWASGTPKSGLDMQACPPKPRCLAQEKLSRAFRALSDPTRRQIISLLREAGDLKVTDLAQAFSMSFNGVSKHIMVLETAGLVTRSVEGREHWLCVNGAGKHSRFGTPTPESSGRSPDMWEPVCIEALIPERSSISSMSPSGEALKTF